MPAGLGFHPYWLRDLGEGPEEVTARVPDLRRYPCKGMIPVGPPAVDDVTRHLAEGRPLSTLTLDDVFLGSSDGAEITWPRSKLRVSYGCSPELGHLVVYTGPTEPKTFRDRIFCIEPVTMVNDGFNLASRGEPATGVSALRIGESMRATWSVRVERIQGA
jgi:aldose 1-epimerase